MTGDHPIREILEELNPDAILFDDCDAALVGIAGQQYKPPLAVYEYELLVQVFVDQGMDLEDAMEWVSFNVQGVWAGDHTPLILGLEGFSLTRASVEAAY